MIRRRGDHPAGVDDRDPAAHHDGMHVVDPEVVGQVPVVGNVEDGEVGLLADIE